MIGRIDVNSCKCAQLQKCKTAHAPSCTSAKMRLFKNMNQAQLQLGTGAMVQLCTIAQMHQNCTEETMRKLTISINKGGVGKTMCAKSLSLAAADTGLNVVSLDLDSQRNLADWGK